MLETEVFEDVGRWRWFLKEKKCGKSFFIEKHVGDHFDVSFSYANN